MKNIRCAWHGAVGADGKQRAVAKPTQNPISKATNKWQQKYTSVMSICMLDFHPWNCSVWCVLSTAACCWFDCIHMHTFKHKQSHTYSVCWRKEATWTRKSRRHDNHSSTNVQQWVNLYLWFITTIMNILW